MHRLRQHIAATTALIFIFPVLIMTTSTVFAAEVPNYNIGDAIKGAAPPPSEPKKPATPPEIPVIVQEEKPLSLADGEKLFVKDFKLEGAEQADMPELAAILAPYRNRELTMAEITELANKLTLFCRGRGYLVAKAYVPKQDAKNGILLIKIVLGKYGKFTLKNTSLVRDFLVQGVFDETMDASPTVTQAGLEHAILLVGAMPGSKIPTVTIAPGAAPGTSDFEVKAEAAQRVNGYLMGDNQGSHFTGRNRLYGGIDVNSPFGIADKFSISGMTTDETDLWNLRLAYGFPLASNGLRAELAASHTSYQLGGIYTGLDAIGTANVVEGTVSYPIKRSRNENYDFFVNMAYKNLKDDLRAVDSRNPREAVAGTLTLQREGFGSLFGHNLYTLASGGFSFGSLKMNNDEQKTLNEAGADTEGFYSKADLAFSASLELTRELSARFSFKLQQVLSGNNLDSNEQFFISGISGVKAYSESIGFDNGTLVDAELRYALPALFSIKHSVGLFFDSGWAYAEKGAYTTNDSFVLNDVGAGYYVNFKQLFLTVQVAQPIGKTGGVDDPGTRFLMQLGAAF